MNQAVAIREDHAVQTANEIKAQVRRVQEVMQAVMKRDTHYGQIPGTQKPTLYKAGAEVLLSTFRIAVEPEVEDLSTSDEIRYRVRAVGRHQTTGIVMGVGVGECSSNEEKYRWRDAVCDEEYDDTDEDRRRIKYQRGRNGHWKRKQIRTEPADIANTVLKMAKKRAQIDMTLTALAASDIFAQDLEDMPDGMQSMADDSGKPHTSAPQSTSDGKVATEKQVNLLRTKLDQKELSAEDLCKHFQIGALTELPFASVNNALAWIAEQ